MIGIVLLSVCIIGLTILAMAVGPLFSRPCLRGSCGVLASSDADGAEPKCGTCPLRQGRKE